MDNVQKVAQHAEKITQFLLFDEKRHLIPRDFMISQKFITEKMRAYLVDWIAELHNKLKLMPETLYVTVGIIDRYLSLVNTVSKSELQILGVTALNIASKYEEIYTPDLKNLLRIGNLADARESVLKMETLVLTCLQFDITFPSVYRFIERFARLAQFS